MGTSPYESYCEVAEALLAVRRGDQAAGLAGLAGLAGKLLAVEALPFAAIVLSEQAEEAAGSGDRKAAAEAADRLRQVAGEIDRPLLRRLSGLGTAWSHWSDGDAGDAREAAERAVSILDDLGYRAFSGRAWEIFGRSLSMLGDAAAGDALDGRRPSSSRAGRPGGAAGWRRPASDAVAASG